MTTQLVTLPLTFATAPSPLGQIFFALHGEKLAVLYFDEFEDRARKQLAQSFGARIDEVETIDSGDNEALSKLTKPLRGAVQRVHTALNEYFSGKLDALDSLPRDPRGTPFQLRVWEALGTIPAGETRSYAQIAAQVGSPKGMRAVGLANGKNPISLAVPCHRVIGADRSLTGYGGGMHRKQWLLEHEKVRGFTKELALTS
jgi:methylated-DNA-[protein]-cysteine S-methyltransferase